MVLVAFGGFILIGLLNPARPLQSQERVAGRPGSAAPAAASDSNTLAGGAEPVATGTAPRPPDFNPYAGAIKTPGKSKRAWDLHFMAAHQHAQAGEAIEFELTEGRMASGHVQITQYRNGEMTYISGQLELPEAGEFFFLTPPALGVAGRAVGVVLFAGSQTAYRLEPTGPNGDPELWERRWDEVICSPPPVSTLARNASAEANRTAEIPPLRPDEIPTYVPDYNSNIVSLQSLPGAKGVLYLDFAGGYTPTWGGVYYSRPAAANNYTIRDVWKRVAEDYLPFNINVTTDIKVYLDAPEISRQRVAFTDTPVTAAGVAMIGSWNWGGDVPCWSVYSTGKSAGEVASHEAGHTLGLAHQGTSSEEYYAGHGSGETGWAPIMGVGYYQPVTQWAKGEYNGATQPEDELNLITANNNTAYRADDTGASLATSRFLEVYPDGSVAAEGVIERTGDTDAFRFSTTGGEVALTARPVGDWSNLGLAVSVADDANAVLHTNNQSNRLWGSIKTNLPPGTYTFRVTGVGKNNPLNNGFSAYASLGYYSIVGSVPGAVPATRLQVWEAATNGTAVGLIPPPVAGDLAYAIAAGNSNQTFAVDNNGLLTVANNALLHYDQLASNAVYWVGFELFVNITNRDNPALTELHRRVVVEVRRTGGSYPLAVSGFNAGVILPYNATVASPQTTGFDVPNRWAFYQAGLNGNAQIVANTHGLQGLPSSRIVRGQGDGAVFELGSYGGLNALMLGYTYTAAGTLTLTPPLALNRISVLASSANGGGVGTFVLNFTDGTHSSPFSFNAPDWYYQTANVAWQGFGRVRLGAGSFNTENPGWDNPNLYQTTVDLAALGLNKTIQSLTFTGPPVGGTRTTAILGISGEVMPARVVIVQSPVSQTNNAPASPSTFTVTAMGAPVLHYQWHRGVPGSSVTLPGANAATLTRFPVTPAEAGNYFVVVSNDWGAVTSAVATLTVHREPQILAPPGPAYTARAVGRSVSFSVGAVGAQPLYFFWQKDGTNLPGAISPTLNLPSVQPAQAGAYSVWVSNAFGSVVSGAVLLAVTNATYPYAQLVLADNPVGYWPLNETGGATAYDWAAGRDGVYHATQLGQPGHRLVDTHTAARFGFLAAQNSYVGSIPMDFGSAPNQSLTVEAWVKSTSLPASDAGLITKGTGAGGEQFNLDCGGPGRAFRFFVRKDDGGTVIAAGNVPPNNQWQHVVGVLNRSAGYVALYVNGISNAAANNFPTEPFRGLLRSTNAMTIGSRQEGAGAYNFQFKGYMQDVAVYDHALSPARILAHFQAASNRPPVFAHDPIVRPTANAGQFYSSAINTEADDPNGDAIFFTKVSGPGWLTVANNGAISGIPAPDQPNTNVFVVSARDAVGAFNTATLLIAVNVHPLFLTDPLTLPDVSPGGSLAGNLATNVTDLNPGDVLSFAKISGPPWVQVAAGGAISGTPTSADVGDHAVGVSVTDLGGLSASATLLVRVVLLAAPLQVSLLSQGEHLLLAWTGGTPPYQVEMTTNLAHPEWLPLGEPTTATSRLVTPSNAATFYRLRGN